jgi:hypothetical protein
LVSSFLPPDREASVTYLSRCTGRPCAINAEDFDVKAPLDIEDEELWQWELATKEAGRPVPKPASPSTVGVPEESEVSQWESLQEQNDIIGTITSTIYAIKRDNSKMRESVQSVDERLTRWRDALISELRWCVASFPSLDARQLNLPFSFFRDPEAPAEDLTLTAYLTCAYYECKPLLPLT